MGEIKSNLLKQVVKHLSNQHLRDQSLVLIK